MKKLRFPLAFFLITMIALTIVGCGGGDNTIFFQANGITTTSLPAGTTGASYTGTLTVRGGIAPYTWSITAGALPAGLTLNATTGVISGTPTATGTANFTVTVTDSSTPPLTFSKALSITVSAPAALTITTASLPGGVIGTAYSQTLAATGGVTPYSWSISVGALPAGLTLNGVTGAITGTPTTAGTASFTIMVSDSANPVVSVTKALSITVTAAPVALSVTTATLAGGTVGTAYSQTLAATGGTTPYTWSISAGALPAGLTLTAATGAITGTPTTAATANFTVMVTDSATPTAATATKALSITVTAAPVALSITTASLPAEVLGSPYSQTLAATGGTPPYTWSISAGTLAPGLTLAAATGIISGTPLTAGAGNFTVMVTDSATPAGTATKALSVTSSTAAGLTAFNTNCSGCHGTLTPGVGVSGSPIIFPSSITALNAAIAANTGGMGFLSALPASTLAAIAGVLF